jgi:hypothetical protein
MRRALTRVLKQGLGLARHSALVAAVLLVSSRAPALEVELGNWQASPGSSAGHVVDVFSDVAITGFDRVFSGTEQIFILGESRAALYTASGDPGSSPITMTDLGLTENWSVATAIQRNSAGRLYATASVILPSQETRSYVFSSNDLGNPVQVLSPSRDPNVALVAINKNGISVGSQGDSFPLAAFPNGISWRLTRVPGAQLRAVNSTNTLFGGSSQPIAGWANTATVFSNFGVALFQDTVTGEVWDLEGDFAVGTRDGNSAYWQHVGGTYEVHVLEDELGTPLEGELLAIDHVGVGIAGGHYVDAGGSTRPMIVNLDSQSWFDLETLLSLEPDTLDRVVGIDVLGDQVAFAVVADDGTGWDVRADILPRASGPVVPGPGLLLALPLLVVGLRTLRRRR